MKSFQQLKEELQETPVNSMGGGFSVSPAASQTGNIAGYDPVLFATTKKKKEKFAGCDVFKIKSEEYTNCVQGRQRYERWGKKLNMDEINNKEIRSYAHKNPGKPVIVMDEKTGVMSYLIPPVRR